jgi:hypothetical protein
MSVDTRTAHTVAHTVNRLVIDTDTSFDDLRQSYESLLPTIDFAELTALVIAGDPSAVKQYTAEHAPHTPASAVDGHMIASDLGRDLRRRC